MEVFHSHFYPCGCFFHLCLNLFSQLPIGMDLEKCIGTCRVAFVYLISGIGGNIMSALFLTKQLQAGASGCMFGLLSLYAVDYALNWKFYQRPKRKAILWFSATMLSFVFGIFPGVDNFAHLGGSVTGLLAGIMVIPQTFNRSKKKNLKWLIWRIVCTVLLAVLLSVGLIIFYTRDPNYVCNSCETSSCIKLWNWCK